VLQEQMSTDGVKQGNIMDVTSSSHDKNETTLWWRMVNKSSRDAGVSSNSTQKTSWNVRSVTCLWGKTETRICW